MTGSTSLVSLAPTVLALGIPSHISRDPQVPLCLGDPLSHLWFALSYVPPIGQLHAGGCEVGISREGLSAVGKSLCSRLNSPVMKILHEHGTALGVTGGFGGKKSQARLRSGITKRKRATDRWGAETSLVGGGKYVAQGSGPGGLVSSKGLLTDFYSDKSVFLAQVTLLARTVGAQANTWPNHVTSALKNIKDHTECLPEQAVSHVSQGSLVTDNRNQFWLN